MRRWHQERDLMLRRWRQEIAKHEASSDEGYPYAALAPVPPTGVQGCHCYRGMGTMRKRSPWDCGNPRCGVCHHEKWLPKARHAARRAAIDAELNAG
jgi:hypothetical protein